MADCEDKVAHALRHMTAEARFAIVQASGVYCRTYLLSGEQALVSVDHDGTHPGFAACVQALRHGKALTNLGLPSLINSVLLAMTPCISFMDLVLDKVDGVVLTRLGRHMLRIGRKGGAPDAGVMLVIELHDVRQRVHRTREAQPADHVMGFLCAFTAYAIAGMAVAAVAHHGQRKRR
jgi:hypothetical protein